MAKTKKDKVLNYNVIFQEETSGGYSVWVPELPGCASQGESLNEAQKNIIEAIQLYLEDAPKEELEEAALPRRSFLIPISLSLSNG